MQFFRRFRLTKYAEHGIMEFARWPERQRAAQRKAAILIGGFNDVKMSKALEK